MPVGTAISSWSLARRPVPRAGERTTHHQQPNTVKDVCLCTKTLYEQVQRARYRLRFFPSFTLTSQANYICRERSPQHPCSSRIEVCEYRGYSNYKYALMARSITRLKRNAHYSCPDKPFPNRVRQYSEVMHNA